MTLSNDSILQLADEVEFSQLDKDKFLLSNSLHRHYVKINQETYNLLLLIDGKKTVSEICVDFNSKYSKEISTRILTELLQNKLAQYGVLKGFDHAIKLYEKPSYLKLSVKVVDEKYLSMVVRIFSFLFYKWIAIPLIVASVAVIGLFLYLNFHLYQSFNFLDSLLFMILFMTISLIFHEMGHVTSTRYFGAKHGGIGIGFYLLSPVFYADVTDVWRLKKGQRIIVNLAGVYFELIFCAVMLLGALLFHSNAIIIVSLTIFIRTLFNLNPFLRSDGYWILSDLLSMPNLMAHAYKRIGEGFSWMKGKNPEWKVLDWFLLCYGVMNYLSIAFFLYYLLIVNPNSILLFPQRLASVATNMFNGDYTVSFQTYFELLIPFTFFILAFNFLRPVVLKLLKKSS